MRNFRFAASLATTLLLTNGCAIASRHAVPRLSGSTAFVSVDVGDAKFAGAEQASLSVWRRGFDNPSFINFVERSLA